MTTLDFNSQVQYLGHTSNYSIDSIRKEYAKENLPEVGKITSDDLGLEISENVIGNIYELDDNYLVIIDSYELDESFFHNRLDEAMKMATDRVYELSQITN